MQVNRCLKDKHFDHIDHALGRPVNPMGETYRNYFAIEPGSPLGKEFRSSRHWKVGNRIGGMDYFHVTSHGRWALHNHLREIRDSHRLYAVEWSGCEIRVTATSRGRARYRAYLRVSDCDPDITFKKFAGEARVWLVGERS